MSGVVLFLLLFYTFFKIGLFGFGGGYADAFHDSGRSGNKISMAHNLPVHRHSGYKPNDTRSHWNKLRHLCWLFGCC